MRNPSAASNARSHRDRQTSTMGRKRPGPKSNTASTEDQSGTCQRPSNADSAINESLCGLLFDSLASVETAILSATEKVPYTALRQLMALGAEERRELMGATHAVVAKHAAFFVQHKNAVELALVLTALGAAKVDHLLSVVGPSESPSPAAQEGVTGVHVCSLREALGIALIVFAPLGILALVWLVQHLRRK